MNIELEESYKHFKNILDNANPFTMSPYTYSHLATILNYIENSIPKSVVEEKIKELDKENTDIKDVYIRTAKHLDKKGMFELSEYMLAQIETTPTFTTWEEYTTWISKQVIQDKIEELNKRIERYREYIELGIETDTEWVDNVADRQTVKVLQELLQEKGEKK